MGVVVVVGDIDVDIVVVVALEAALVVSVDAAVIVVVAIITVVGGGDNICSSYIGILFQVHRQKRSFHCESCCCVKITANKKAC